MFSHTFPKQFPWELKLSRVGTDWLENPCHSVYKCSSYDSTTCSKKQKQLVSYLQTVVLYRGLQYSLYWENNSLIARLGYLNVCSCRVYSGMNKNVGSQSSIDCSVSTLVAGSPSYFSCAVQCSTNITLQTLCRWASQHLCEVIKHRNLTLQRAKGRLRTWFSLQAYREKQSHSISDSFRHCLLLLYLTSCEDCAYPWGLIWFTAV